jgi:hypothetical protein
LTLKHKLAALLIALLAYEAKYGSLVKSLVFVDKIIFNTRLTI